jgi:hypothetical protein
MAVRLSAICTSQVLLPRNIIFLLLSKARGEAEVGKKQEHCGWNCCWNRSFIPTSSLGRSPTRAAKWSKMIICNMEFFCLQLCHQFYKTQICCWLLSLLLQCTSSLVSDKSNTTLDYGFHFQHKNPRMLPIENFVHDSVDFCTSRQNPITEDREAPCKWSAYQTLSVIALFVALVF